MENEQLAYLIRFGPFELDRRSGELSRDGRKIPLQEQSFRILELLTSCPGEIVSREEIRSRLWPGNTIVEFENAVNAAIKKLRTALGDSAEEPLYIETLRRRGYRLIVPVENASPAERRTVPAPPLADFGSGQAASPAGEVSSPLRIGSYWKAVVAAALLIFLATLYQRSRRAVHATPKLTDRDSIVLADFANKTGDPVFTQTLRQGLAVQLDQSPFLSLVSDERIQQELHLMAQPPGAELTPTLAQEVCERAGGAAMLEGSIASLGSQYVLWLRAKNCHNGNVIDEEQMQAVRKEDVLSTLSQIATRFRIRVGESLQTVESHNTLLAEATTPSLEALKAYSAGRQIQVAHGASAALPFFQRATEIDPQFAMAHASLGRMYADLDQHGLAAASMIRGWQLRERASDREKFFITTNYEILVTGNLEAAQQTCEAWARTYPRESLPHNVLAGVVNKTPGRYEKALAETSKAIELDPYFWLGYYSLGALNVYLGRLDDGDAALHAAAARGLDADEFIMLAYDIDFLKDDRAGMEREAARARARSGGENWISAREAFVAAYSGHLQNARIISNRAVAQAQQVGQPERGALWAAGAAIREAQFGNKQAATEWAHSALDLSTDRDVEYGSALALAIVGDSSHAQTLTDQIEKQFPEDTAVRFNYLPTLRAVLALNRAKPQQAVELLQVAAPHELGIPVSAISGMFGALYPVYVRGQAYLDGNKPTEAAAEFQKILDHRGIVGSDPIGALARLQLGRANALAGDKAKAQGAYQAFFALWKDADADIPIFKQAKAEYGKLQ